MTKAQKAQNEEALKVIAKMHRKSGTASAHLLTPSGDSLTVSGSDGDGYWVLEIPDMKDYGNVLLTREDVKFFPRVFAAMNGIVSEAAPAKKTAAKKATRNGRR